VSAAAEAQFARWRAPLLWLSLAGFSFGVWSGSALLFFGGLLGNRELLVEWHWIAGLAMLGPYGIYQLRHYLRVRAWTGRVHFNVGLATFCTVLGLLGTGIPLIFWVRHVDLAAVIVDLAHSILSFVFLILIAVHLTLVTRITLGNRGEASEAKLYAARAVKFALWGPPVAGLVALIVVMSRS
jgi:hypothetical protein